MSLENQVSIKVTEEKKAEVLNAVGIIRDQLNGLLITLTPQQRKDLPKMGDGTIPFVQKTLDYGKSNPEFAPTYINIEELEIDLMAVKDLSDIYRPILQQLQQLDDSILLSGSEAYVSALAYYNAVKLAARMNAPGAKAIYEDLKQRFTKSPVTNSEDQQRELR